MTDPRRILHLEHEGGLHHPDYRGPVPSCNGCEEDAAYEAWKRQKAECIWTGHLKSHKIQVFGGLLARYLCERCGERWTEYDKLRASVTPYVGWRDRR